MSQDEAFAFLRELTIPEEDRQIHVSALDWRIPLVSITKRRVS
jgi:hypothetical protein